MLFPTLKLLQNSGGGFLAFRVWRAAGVGLAEYRTTVDAFGVVPAAKVVLSSVSVQLPSSIRQGRHQQARSLRNKRDASSVAPIDR